jgi:hypothetical protein
MTGTRQHGEPGRVHPDADGPCRAAARGHAGVRLVVRGNGERYFVHLRTSASVRPWQFHQAGFDTDGGLAEVRLPFEAFRPSGGSPRAAAPRTTMPGRTRCPAGGSAGCCGWAA